MVHQQVSINRYTEQDIKFLIAVIEVALARKFEDAEFALIDALLHDFSIRYEEISQTRGYSKNYLRGQVGPRLWQDLSSVFQNIFRQPINKSSFERFVKHLAEQFNLSDDIDANQIRSQLNLELSNEIAVQHTDTLAQLYGRNIELSELSDLLSNYQCVSLVGAIGVGKTSLASHWVQSFGQNQFDVVIWRSLIHAPTPELLVDDLIRAFRQTSPKSFTLFSEKLNFLMTLLQQQRCLIVLDSAESIIQTTAISALNTYGDLRDYNQLIRYMTEQKHQSSLLLLSRQRFNQIVRLHHSKRSAQEMMLSGLALEAAQKILATHQLKDQSSWNALIEMYQGNPGLLMQISRYIETCFGGRVRHFLRCGTIVVPDEASKLYLEQIHQLSESDRIVLLDLATQNAPVQLSELYGVVKSRSTLIKSLTRLVELCLVERRVIESDSEPELVFDLAPVVKKIILAHPP
ncbi:NB-ARC domain-containing protein [Leptolyngbya sp. NIES-2104]|uniref:NB-ARC domain-containing protein n=1 Tax=Leptolyngbya sp. NIES-2104 TaxID=1552121 RepID=UPI0006EC6C43|nr:NB-ARC domain-containing protein [Leptolyngbya sp. NIES-2104]GAP99574.1 WD-repeat protein [Leptolyngbya sp. NIES-2104]